MEENNRINVVVPKDYTGTDFTATKGASDFQFTPNYIE